MCMVDLHTTIDAGATVGTTAFTELVDTGLKSSDKGGIDCEMQSPATSDLVPLQSTVSTSAAMIILHIQ